ncbi:hypothetical protein [Pseudomonas lactis]|uniref:hypothetical protein n=1 Tax=Pseudomonas lactis TaxID=1615674 RepID=UPI0019E2F9FB|nr:hypothetical protein [Pseudomonas lactis]MBA6043734.1 hypothetical protein [Pseudomonas lactis]
MADGVLLMVTISLAVLVSLMLVACFVGKGEWGWSRVNSTLQLDTSQGLAHQGLLWLSISTPVAIAVSLGLWVWPKYSFELSPAGFKNFIDISILPLAIMSLSLPLSGLIAKFHSTQQTAKQIEVVSFKNNLDAFYTHRKEMLAYFAALDKVDYFGVATFEYNLHPVLHLRFFSGTPENGLPAVDMDAFRLVEASILSAAKFLKGVLVLDRVTSISTLDIYLHACESIRVAAESLHITKITRDFVLQGVLIRSEKCKPPSYDMVTLGTTTLHALAAIRFVRGFYDNLCDFAGVSRWVVSKELDLVFYGGKSLIEGELQIELLHKTEIQHLVEIGSARYNEKHPLLTENFSY